MTSSALSFSPDARFAVRTDAGRSRFWRVRSGAKRPELFIERERLEQVLHVSLHESGQWHLSVEGEYVRRWPRPAEIVPGYTRAVVVVVPPAVACHADSAPARTSLVELDSHSNEAAHFGVFIERAGANPATWPGKNSHGTNLVARLPLAANEGTCAIVVQHAPLAPGSFSSPGRPSDADLAEMRRRAQRGSLLATLFGEEADGALSVLDVRADPDIDTDAVPLRAPAGE